MTDQQSSETQAHPPSLSDVGKQDSNPNGIPSLAGVQRAMEDQQIPTTTSREEDTTPPTDTTRDGDQGDSTPIGRESTQLSDAELSALKENAAAFEALQQHPEILSEAVQRIRAKYGETDIEGETPSQDGSGEQLSPAFKERLDTLEQAITMLASRLVTSEMASKEPQWESLEPQVHKLMNEIPGLTLQQAVRFAKAEANKTQGGQQGTAPALETAEGHGAAPRVGELSYSDEFNTAANNVKKLKSSRDAADLAMREALRLAQIKQQS